MAYVIMLLLLCGAVFLFCYLIDLLCKKLFPKSELQRSGRVVRLPRRGLVFGIALPCLSFFALLGFWEQMELFLILGCGLVFLMGAFLLLQYLAFSICYDDRGFEYRRLARRRASFTYDEIRGQRSLLTRAGVNSTLFVGAQEINLYSAMTGLSDFLNTAFHAWCKHRSVDPDTVPGNHAYFTYFPEPSS